MAKARKMNRGIGTSTKNHPDSGVKLVTISLGHIISNQIEMKAFCGVQGYQWHYGGVNSVACIECVELYEASQVPVKK